MGRGKVKGKEQGSSNDAMKSILNEIKKLNWKEVNDKALKSFMITVIGDDQTHNDFYHALETSKYDFMGVVHYNRISLKEDAKSMVINVYADKLNENTAIIHNSDIIIVDKRFIVDVQLKISNFFIFDNAKQSEVFEKIVSENKDLMEALCYNYPAFRTEVARRAIISSSFQNAAWAGGTAITNVIPGPHEAFTAPIEALSDFTVLTMNEVKMIFILASISGRKVNPALLIPEMTIILSGAKGAQMLATQIIGKLPAGTGVALKAAIAFAFTYAIGEGAYLNMNYGVTFDKRVLKERVEDLKSFGEKMTKDMFKKAN